MTAIVPCAGEVEPACQPTIPAGLPLVFGSTDRLLRGHTSDRTWWSPRSDDTEYADRILADLRTGDRAARDGSPAVAVGTLSFRPDAPALFSPLLHGESSHSDLLPSGSTHSNLLPSGSTRLPTRTTPVQLRSVTEVPDRRGYLGNVSAAVTRLRTGEHAAKVVLGRWLELETASPLDPLQVLGSLAETSRGAVRLFAVPAPAVVDAGAEPAILLGASPELLVSRRGRLVRSNPMAGSVPRSSDPTTDALRARALLDSVKDSDEHRYVAEAVAAVLRPLCDGLVVDGPKLIRTDTVWHLSTEIHGRLADRHLELSALHLAQLLQPTPAVGGTPTDWALQTIAELEGARGCVTGAVGWVDATGDGSYAVGIRSGLLTGHTLRLFAGAGIVAASDPESELIETEAKLATMLGGLGLSTAAVKGMIR